MTISWTLLESWMKRGGAGMPVGWELHYEYVPSTRLIPSIHTVHAYWKVHNPELEERKFWHLEKEEQQEWESKWRAEQHKIFRVRDHRYCVLQRFTLTDINGKEIILQMNSQGKVEQLKRAERTIEVLIPA